ncbi:AAA family ATPase [Xylariaceae sp. AK1471]|nr:AAA family ATPase [Xylariaceae sp. AK1471]
MSTDSKRRIEELENELAKLRGSAKSEATFQVFNTFSSGSTVYLGVPTWNASDEEISLKGNLPIPHPEMHIQRQGNVAFVVYQVFDGGSMIEPVEKARRDGTPLPDPKPTWVDIKLYSPAMKDAFKSFFERLRELNEELPEVDPERALESPFLFWYHYRSAKVLDSLPSGPQKLVKLLTDWIDNAYGEHYAQADEEFGRGVVTRKTIDYLICPGDIVISKFRERWRGYKSKGWLQEDKNLTPGDSYSDSQDSVQEDDQDFILPSWRYDYDGQFWKASTNLPFHFKCRRKGEEIKITSLGTYPLRFADDDLKLRLEKQGKTFWLCRYKRLVSYQPDKDEELTSTTDERYMVDFATYRRLHSETPGFHKAYPGTTPHNYMSSELMDKETPPPGTETLFPLTISGFNLRRKKWVDLEVDRIGDVQWHKEAFDHLVIDEETKELIEALITNRIASEKSTDWVTAKGNGLIMLLHGGPGTGKTFTAESVAELAERPLYPVTCGDIGTKPEEVEQYLESVLNLGRLWGCIVLLDEADVFLEQRTLNDLTRNALVSVFLRVLEYYEGILILTSNRVGIFDEAFKSRIQLALHYDNLGRPQRVKVWKNFFNRLKRLGEENIDYDTVESYIEELSEYEMNGRQIRNAITTARQLARFKGKPMTYGHLRHVIKVAGKFDDYIKTVHESLTDDQIARDEGLR